MRYYVAMLQYFGWHNKLLTSKVTFLTNVSLSCQKKNMFLINSKICSNVISNCFETYYSS